MISRKRHRSSTPEASSSNSRKKTAPAEITNHATVQNQAVSQTVNGSQFYGPVSIHNGTSASRVRDDSHKLHSALLASLAFPGMLDRRDNVAQPHEGTCRWILELEQYHAWMSQSHGLLWIKGKPGSGKSTMMSFLHREIRKATAVEDIIHLDFFFHARGSELQHTQTGMLRSLLNQLLRQCQNARLDTAASFREKCGAYGDATGSWEWQKPELERLLADALMVASASNPILLFIDALDEAGSGHARAIAAYFHKINDRSVSIGTHQKIGGLKICMSSRHYPMVSMIRGGEICMEQYNAADIEIFVRDEIGQALRFSNEALNKMEWHGLAGQILEHARGVFQWVLSVINILFDSFDRGFSIEETSNLLQGLPEDLEDIYGYILSSLMTPSAQRHANESLLLFQWVCFSERPLTLIELMYAISTVNNDKSTNSVRPETDITRMEKRIKDLSGGLVELVYNPPPESYAEMGTSEAEDEAEIRSNVHCIEAGRTTVQIIHQTAREFLLEKGLKILIESCTSDLVQPRLTAEEGGTLLIQRCHSSLYWCCLARFELLNEDGFKTKIEEIPRRYEHRYWRDFIHDLLADFPLLYYALQYVLDHARKASICRSSNPFQEILQIPEMERLEQIRLLWNKLVELGIISDRYGQGGWSLLHFATFFNVESLIESLIAKGCDLLQFDFRGNTPLHVVARHQNSELCKLLISSGADVNFVAPYPESALTVLQQSIYGDDTTTMELILHAGADINAQAGRIGTALHLAARLGHKRDVQTLVDAGADVNALDSGHMTPMQGSAFADVEDSAFADVDPDRTAPADVVQILLDAGADVNSQGGYLGTALQAMAYNGHERAVKLLISAGADVNLRGGKYGTALRLAYASNQDCRDNIIKMLLEAGAEA